jgi:predicted DCC family thiol-disulfide oxidoreductase YuxK
MTRDWLIWDGACGFCCWWVVWARRRGAERRFRIVSYQEAASPPMTEALRERARRAVQVVTAEGRELSAGRACLYVLARIQGRAWNVLTLPPFIWGVEIVYRIVARNRVIFGRFTSRDPGACKPPSSDTLSS